MATAKLEVRHDGIRANAQVILQRSGGALPACSLDAVIEAALQSDASLAAGYADILREIAPELYVVISKEIDGDRDAGCCWFAVEIKHGINGETLTLHPHRFTRQEFRGWSPKDAEIKTATQGILRRACMIGLRDAQYWVGSARTVAEAAL